MITKGKKLFSLKVKQKNDFIMVKKFSTNLLAIVEAMRNGTFLKKFSLASVKILLAHILVDLLLNYQP